MARTDNGRGIRKLTRARATLDAVEAELAQALVVEAETKAAHAAAYTNTARLAGLRADALVAHRTAHTEAYTGAVARTQEGLL